MGLPTTDSGLSVFPVSLVGGISEWFTKECIGSITTWDNMVEKFILKLHHLSDHNEEEETEEDDNPNKMDNVPEIFKIEGNLFDFETPLCEAYYEIQLASLKTILNSKGTEKPWSENRVPHQLCDHIVANPTTLRVEELNGPRVHLISMVSVMVETARKGLNAHEIAPFPRMENFRWGPYANMKTEWPNNSSLYINRTFGKDYEASNTGYTQENQEHKGNLIPEPSNCKVRRFEMMKYSFNYDKEYITIKESEYTNHSK
ncbi:hypothetical protein Tco_1114127 [Tanacetum coccineum]|uniref:Uncharacterized protein n=1 Tax=Tanacetum coccineum TaxID=301880 RepID=A0ABQ5IUA5_9ASTR